MTASASGLRNLYEEKRGFPRMVINSPLDYQLVGETQTHHGQAINLSGNGVLLRTEQELESGQQLEIAIASGAQHRLRALVTIKRVSIADANHYDCACVIERLLD